MKVRYLGHACFEFTSNDGVKVITDPYTKVGYELPCGLTADVITVSHSHFDHNYIQVINARYIVSELGEYMVDGVFFEGVASFHDPKMGALRGKNIIYKIKVDGLTICHMGDIGEEYTDALAKKIGKVDLLCIPVGGTYTVDAIGAKKYIDCLKPKMVIPMHYRPSDGALDIAGIKTFTGLYNQDEVTCIQNGVLDINEQTQGIIYMERVKGV